MYDETAGGGWPKSYYVRAFVYQETPEGDIERVEEPVVMCVNGAQDPSDWWHSYVVLPRPEAKHYAVTVDPFSIG